MAFVVLAGTMVLTVLASVYVLNANRAEEQIRFVKSVQNSTREVRDGLAAKMDGYLTLLRATAGLFAAKPDLNRQEFHNYVERLNLESHYPGIRGIGFAPYVAADQVPALESRIRERGMPSFHVWPRTSEDSCCPIIFLEPEDRRNAAAMGFDMYSEPIRRETMQKSCELAAPQATSRVTLVQEIDREKSPGFLIYLPVFRGGDLPPDVQARRQKLIGFVYNPFRAQDLFATAEDGRHQIDFAVYDGPIRDPSHLLFRTEATIRGTPENPASGTAQIRTETVQVAGREWAVDFFPHDAAESHSAIAAGAVVFLTGTLIAACLFVLTLSQSWARASAERGAAELRRSQDALRASESRLRRLVDSNLIGVVIADGSGRIVDANQAFLRMIGYTRQEMEQGAIDWKRLAPTEVRPFSGPAPLDPLELQYTRKDGAKVPVLVGLADLGGTEALTAGFIFDLTERKRDEQERARLLESAQAARADAEAANRSKDEFLATLSHELRTPLNAILGWAQLLRMGGLEPDEVDRALETIERNAKVQAQLVEDLLDLSRIISGKLRLDLRPIELPPVIDAALDSVRPAASAKGIFILPVLDAHASPVLGDADRLQQVVWNLLSNAIKFTPSGGRVELFLQRTANQAEISVSDTGQGISAEFLPQVFDRLRQADGSSTRRHGGLGLGLAIVRHLVELHGGWVSAKSRGIGQGATFTVCLPLASRIPEVSPPAPTGAGAGGGRGGVLSGVRALVVDDEHDARELISRVLERAGAQVAAAASASEAMRVFRDFRPTALLSDISMPGEDGYCLMREIRRLDAAEGGKVPAVALTAFARTEDRLQALDAGFQAHVSKPFEPAELTALVLRLTRAHSIAAGRRYP